MATAIGTWAFPTNSQSWGSTVGGSSVASWLSTDGSPANGCLQFSTTGKSVSNSNYWELTGSWETLFGISTGQIVTQVGGGAGDGFNWRCSNYATAAASIVGPFDLRDSSGNALANGTMTGTVGYSGTSAFANRVGSAVTVPSAQQAGAGTIKLRITNTMATGNNNSANNKLLHDQVIVTITYSAAPVVAIPTAMLTGVGK